MNMGKSGNLAVAAALAAVLMLSGSAVARQYSLGGRPIDVYGYITQGAGLSLHNDYYDTEEDINSAITNIFGEMNYSVSDNFKVYLSGILTVDWIYEMKHSDKSWRDREFNKSRDKLFVEDEYWQLLKEAHFTWTPENFLFRVGKQIVAWGETDGFRLMDQINPLDQARGLADVEFETTIIPIWLIRAEYFPNLQISWLQDMALQFIFNPNADFISDRRIRLGNDKTGIWAPNVEVSKNARLGSAIEHLDEPTEFDDEGYEYAVRLQAMAWDSLFSLNYFYGRENSPVEVSEGLPGTSEASDGKTLLHLNYDGYYPLLRFLGGTFTRDIPVMNASFLGGVAPVLRLETFYAFDNTFATSDNKFEQSDEWRWAVGMDWKVRIKPLNEKYFFSISPQFYHRKIRDYPHAYDYAGVEDDNYLASLMISTSYYLNKISPSFFWLRDVNNRANLFKYQVVYDHTDYWRYTIGALFLSGVETTKGFDVFENKDYIYFKISYRWS